jgi:hypothetical protein
MQALRLRIIATAAIAASSLLGQTQINQTQIDLRTQTKSADFSGATFTKPFRTGSTLPSTCSTGEAFFKLNATAGQNLYGCTATNTWTVMSAGSTAGGDVTGALSSLTVAGIQSRPVSAAVPSSGQALVWNATTSQWEPGTVSGGSTGGGGTGTGTGTVTNAVSALGSVANLPVCTSGIVNDVKPCTRSGNSSTYVSQGAGNKTTGDILVYDSTGNAVDGGAPFTRICTVIRTSPTVLTIAPSASVSTPCAFTVGKNRVAFNASATATISGNTGTAWFSYDIVAQTIKVTLDTTTLTSCSGCTTSTGVSVPTLHIPFWKWTSTSGSWDAQGTSLAAEAYGGAPVICSTGLSCTSNADGTQTAAFDSAVLPMKLSSTSTLDFPSTATGACSDLTATLAGALAGDVVHVGPPTIFPAGFLASAFVSAPDTITVRLCNLSGATVNPVAASYAFQITR